MFDLGGKVAVVTGGGRGIGRGISRALAQCGSAVTVVGRTTSVLVDTVEELRGYGVDADFMSADITESGAPRAIVETTIDRFGRIDCWVNNAGAASYEDLGPLANIDEGMWDRVVDLNLKATFFACQAAADAMTDGGSIVNISSRSASGPNPFTGHYGAAKAGVENLSATMAVEWGYRGIRVNCVAPGLVLTEVDETPAGAMSSASAREQQISTVPLGRLGVVDDVGPAVAFLASDEAAWTSGVVIPVNGASRISVGYLAYLKYYAKAQDQATPQ